MPRRAIGNLLERYFRAFDPAFLRRQHPYYDMVDHGSEFDALHERALAATGTKPSLWRRDRYFNLYGSLGLVRDLEGDVAECGIWKGLSTYLICHRLREFDPGFKGEGYALIDSFEGLSAPTAADKLGERTKGKFGDTSVAAIRKTFAEFPALAIYEGWIPEIFSKLPERRYRFVHTDVDLVAPTVASFEYFLPRMVPGGVIVCDDYASTAWPGTKKAVDEVVAKHGLRAMPLSASDLLVIAK